MPVINGGETPAGKFGVRGGLVPAHAAHWKLGSPFGIRSQLPAHWSRTARGVAEPQHGLLPGKRLVILDERLLPVFPPLISAAIYEFLEMPIGNFLFVEPVFRQLNRGLSTQL